MSLSRRFIAGAILANVILAPALADVKAGVDAWQRGNYTAAIAEWRMLAEKGDADAQFNLGQAYKLGRGVPADLKMAQTWYEKAAEQGHEEAQANLGLLMFQTGQQEAAMVWIRKAADRGDPRAEFILGTALFNGDGVEKDVPHAYALMSHAAAQGLIAASTSLAEMENVVPESDRQQGMKIARELLRKDAERTATTRTTETQTAGAIGRSRMPPPVAKTDPLPEVSSSSSVRRAAPSATMTNAPARPASPPNKPAVLASATPPQRTVPTGKPANTASLSTAQGRWRVQLGAYGSLEVAKGQWSALSKKIGLLAGLNPSYEPFGAFTRLRVNSLADRSAAERLCAAAKAAGQPCFPVAP